MVLDEVRDEFHSAGAVLAGQTGGGRIVDDDEVGGLHGTAQHGVGEVLGGAAGVGAAGPKVLGQVAMPLAVVVDKFFEIGVAGESAEHEMVEDRVVQDDDALRVLLGDQALVDRLMELVIA